VAILTPAPRNFQQRIRSELTEGIQLSYYDIIPVALTLRTTLAPSSGALPAVRPNFLPVAGTDIYRVPGDYALVVGEIRAHIAMNELGSESTVGATGLNALVGTRNRLYTKALNTKVTLVNADRNDLTFVETAIQNSSAQGGIFSPMSLASLLPGCGGSPIKLINKGYVMPFIVPGNERLKLSVACADGNAAVGQTEYGLTMLGAFVRSRAG
jgi:hypothetical protein